MKKNLLLLPALAFCASSALAQVGDAPVMQYSGHGSPLFVPSEYSDGSEPVIYFYNEKYGNSAEEPAVIKLFDSNMAEKQSITAVQNAKPLTKKLYTHFKSIKITWSHNEGNPVEDRKFTLEEATEYCAMRNYDNKKAIDGMTLFYPHSTYGWYFNKELYGDRYPNSCYYLQSDGTLLYYDISYRTECETTDGWVLQSTEQTYEDDGNNLIDVCATTPDNKESEGFVISQTLFNDDNKYEYILPLQKYITREYLSQEYIEGYGNAEVRHVDEVAKTVGVKIMSEDGAEIARIEPGIPNPEMTSYIDNVYLIDFGEKKYLSITFISYSDAEREDLTYVYEIDSKNSAIRQVGAPIRTSVSPRIAERSTPVTVNFGGEGTSQRQVVVTAANGMRVMSLSVPAGETSATINTGALAKGLYVVSVVEGGKSMENCKIVIR